MIRSLKKNIWLFLLFSIAFLAQPDLLNAQSVEYYIPELVVCSYPGKSARDSIYFEYDWQRRITSITSSFGGARGVPRKFKITCTYDENGMMKSVTEIPLEKTSYPKQEFQFKYQGVRFLDNIQQIKENENYDVKIYYSAPTDTYSFEYDKQWYNYTFTDAGLVSQRIKGYEVLSVHTTNEDGVIRHVKSTLPLQMIAQSLGGMQLAFNAMLYKKVDLLVYNDQHLFVKTKKDEFGRIAQMIFSSEELGDFQITTIYYKTVKL